MAFTDACKAATAHAHALADALERVAQVPAPKSAPSGTDALLADAVRRGMTPQFIDALKKALKIQ